MKFRARMEGSEVMIFAACPHSSAWLESMGKHSIKAEFLSFVGKMGIEAAFVEGKIFETQKVIGRDKLADSGLLKGKFDALEDIKKPK